MNSPLRNISLVLLALIFAGSVCLSQDSSHAVMAQRLLEIMKIDKTLQQSVDVMLSAQIKANPALAPYEDVMRQFLAKYMSWSSLKEKFVAMYALEFSEEELQAMIDFYGTDIGQRVIEKLPAVMNKGAILGQQVVQEHAAELTEAMQQRSKALEAQTGKDKK